MSKDLLLERMIASGVNIHNMQEVFEFFHKNELGSSGGGLTQGEIFTLFEQWSVTLKEEIKTLHEQWSNLSLRLDQIKSLAERNQLNLTLKVENSDFEKALNKIEENRVALLNKADLTALAMLTALLNTKADQIYVQEQIANLVNGDQSILQAVQEISTALQENEGLLEALDYTVANRVRFDIANQALTALQRNNARANIGAEEIGTASMLIAKITIQSLGGATELQGIKADSALQSGDVAPVALSGLFSSLAGQNKIFDVVYGAYQVGSNTALVATDTIGQMLGKLQGQINAGSKVEWVRANQVGAIHYNIIPSITVGTETMYLEFAKIGGLLWVRGGLTLKDQAMSASSPEYITPNFVTFNNDYKMQVLEKGGAMKTIGVTPNAFTTDGSITRVLFWSDRVCMNQAQANTAVQSINSTNNLYANSTLRIFPTCLGVLLN